MEAYYHLLPIRVNSVAQVKEAPQEGGFTLRATNEIEGIIVPLMR